MSHKKSGKMKAEEEAKKIRQVCEDAELNGIFLWYDSKTPRAPLFFAVAISVVETERRFGKKVDVKRLTQTEVLMLLKGTPGVGNTLAEACRDAVDKYRPPKPNRSGSLYVPSAFERTRKRR